jgi:hypothetical protein
MGTPWWYLKNRKNPTGVMGRPKSPIPIAERRRLARQQYQTNLVQRSQRLIRLLVSAAAADRLDSLARERGVSPGQIVEDLLTAAATTPAPSLPPAAKPAQAPPPNAEAVPVPSASGPIQTTPSAPNAWFSPV